LQKRNFRQWQLDIQYSQKIEFLTRHFQITCQHSKFKCLIRILPKKIYDFKYLGNLFVYITHHYDYHKINFYLEVNKDEFLATLQATKRIKHVSQGVALY
jgi:hypothetical protein